ncbi:MAG: hydantoinase B/oxoprolinase family protein [Alphaproteobacteria bacterium]|jgi:N-methylhydantoinase B|nr:hydantoinase B/oxoprolinase family protein [Alphaproteobacteria bacterium]
MSEQEIDPITLTVIWKGLLSIAEELGVTLRHTAFSEGVREGDDFSTAIFDAGGRMIAQGPFSPGHLGSFPYVVTAALAYFSAERLRPGDAILLNDSALGSGHFPDTFQILPAFLDDRLIGFVCNSAHQVDMGGAAPGSQKVAGVTEAYQEGLRILPVRFVREGEIDEDIMRIVTGNVRMPDKVRGDLMAQLGANRSAAARLARLFADYGAETISRAYEIILARSEASMRAALAKVPAGTYSFEDHLDDYGPETPPVTMAVDVTFDGAGEVTVDFSRSSDQVPAAINSYINYTRAYSVFAIKVFCDAFGPQNAGNMRPIKVVAREGSFFNPRFPAPSGGRAALQVRMFDAINGALAQALPERAMGAFSHWSNPNFGGIDDRTGQPFVMYDLGLAGYGGRHDRDGAEALSPVMNCSNIPVEVHETHNPVRVRRLELIADSGGAGRHRGGSGLRKDIELLNSRATLSLLGDRHRFEPYGVFGGEPGSRAETILNPGRNARSLPSKDSLEIERGDIVSFRLSGAGGYGPPAERDPAALADDVADGYVTPEHARRKYGFADTE